MRHRHALYLSDAMTRHLQVMAETNHVSKSQILETALQRYLAPGSAPGTSEVLNMLHETNARSLRRLERDLAITTELIATFVRTFMTITPPLPSSEHAAARALGQLRFEQVIEDVARRLRTDRTLITRISAMRTGIPVEPPRGAVSNSYDPRNIDLVWPDSVLARHPHGVQIGV